MTERNSDSTPLAPACAATIERLQLVLDGQLEAVTLDADPHPASCAACRERIATARLLLNVLASPTGLPCPARMTDSILAAVREDRLARRRRRAYVVGGSTILATAALLILIASSGGPTQRPPVEHQDPNTPEQVRREPSVAPGPHPVRLGDEFSKVGQALMDTSKPITEPVARAPGVLALISDSFARPQQPIVGFDSAASALAELPDAARAGLEPVTSTTQKAFSRLIHDMGVVQVSPSPKS